MNLGAADGWAAELALAPELAGLVAWKSPCAPWEGWDKLLAFGGWAAELAESLQLGIAGVVALHAASVADAGIDGPALCAARPFDGTA